MYRTASLLRPTPPTHFWANFLYRVVLPPLHTPPLKPLEPYCSSCTCTRVACIEELYLCIKCVEIENWSWPFSLISDGFLRPMILHVILLCSLSASGRSLAARLRSVCKKNCNMYMYVAENSSILQYCHGMSMETVLVFYHTTELR